jgi:hypothetical protein
MSEATNNPSDESTVERHASEELPASVARGFAQWAELHVAPLPEDFTASVMQECLASERAALWADAHAPALPEDFTASVMAECVARDATAEWAAEFVPELPSDFADEVLSLSIERAQGERPFASAMQAWSDAHVEALPDGFAQAVAEQAVASLRDEAPRTSGVVAKVVPIAAPRGARRWIAPAAALGSSIAAAAVAILALSSPPRVPTPARPDAHVARPDPATASRQPDQAGRSPTNNTTSPVVVAQGPSSELSSGSEVEKVDVDGDDTSFTAFSLAGESENDSVAVVWIEDGHKQSPPL